VVETWDLTDDPIDMVVGFSHEGVGEAVARFLHERGRRRIALVGGDDVRGTRRLDACVAQAQAQGQAHVPRRSVTPPGTIGQGRAALRSLLEEDAAIDSVFCTSDMLALGVLTEAQAMGLKVPRQLAVVGFGDMVFARDLEPALTTVRIDGPRIARLAADFIIQAAEGLELEEHVIDIGFSIVERDSA
jgi:LacI family transcriptional regulator, gluconate utilization system Gnt-I transcriptional repressor